MASKYNMSRRHHHQIQPFDYDRFNEQTQKTKDREREARGIEYQDDSLSSINSDEESYLHQLHHARSRKEKKGVYPQQHNTKREPSVKPIKPEKPLNEGHKETKTVTEAPPAPDLSGTSERLGRLEAMLEELIKRGNVPAVSAPPPKVAFPEKRASERADGQFQLDPRRHDFTTSMWINKIQEVSVQHNWNEKNTIQYMASQMSGIIKAWYNSLPGYDFTWPEWKILISRIFPDNVDFITTLKRLVTRLKQPDETMTSYYFSKMYLIDACKITGGDAVSCLIDGLNNQVIQEQAKSGNYLTPESLYSQFLIILPDYTVDYAPVALPSSEPVQETWYYQQPEPVTQDVTINNIPEEEFSYQHQPHQQMEEDFSNFGNHGEIESISRSATNVKPSGTVHSRLDKRFIRPQFKPAVTNKTPLAAKLCTICNNRGHLARYCRKAKKIMYCTFAEEKSKKCYSKDCLINNYRFDAFIDTGCNTVAIKEKVARKLNLNIDSTSDVIDVYGGGSIGIKGTTVFTLQVDLVKKQVRAVVVADEVQDFSVVVGQAFLSQKDVTVLLQNNTVKIFEALEKLTD